MPKTIVQANNISNHTLTTYSEINDSSVCDYQNHLGDKIIKNEKKPWMFGKGYTGDVYCSSCSKLIEKGETISIFAFYAWPLWNIWLFIVFFIISFVILDLYLRIRAKRNK
jgi:hypothetical protein